MVDLLATLVAWRRFILRTTLVVTLGVAGVSLVLPRWYRASTTVFPPETGGGLSMYAQMLGGLSLPVLGGLATDIAAATVHIDVLRSRRVGERLAEEFDLAARYGTGTLEETLDAFHEHCGFTLLDNGLLVVTFEDRDPEMAARILNRMIELLDEVTRELNVTRASRMRRFIEKQLEQRERELREAEDAFNAFQKSRRALEIDEQLRTVLDVVARLTGDAIALETQLDLLRRFARTDAQEYRQKQAEYEAVRAQLRRLKTGEGADDADLVRAWMPALADVPDLALEYMRLKRRVTIESTVYTMLVKEYEKARMEEARDVSTLQVLDPARAPSLRARPRRKLLVMAGALGGFVWSSLLALVVTAWREGRNRPGLVRDVLAPLVDDLARPLRRR